ncbi:MAG: fibronectin type III domain-containing protein [Thermoplasmata archaeon]|nr:fibronectin type III domain-containing protein [Thermoplasmata archaeon]
MEKRAYRYVLVISSLLILLLGSVPEGRYYAQEDGSEGQDDQEVPGDLEAGALYSGKVVKTINNLLEKQVGSFTEINNEVSIAHNDTVLLGYTWKNGTSKFQVSLVASYDKGKTWTSPLDVWSFSNYHSSVDIKFSLHKYKDEVWLFLYNTYYLSSARKLVYKKAAISDWTDLATTSTTDIVTSQAGQWSIATDDNNIYLANLRSSQWQSVFHRYDGTSWTSGVTLSNPGTAASTSIVAYDTGSSTKLCLFYTRSYYPGYATGYVYMRTSTNGGSSWTAATAVMNNRITYSHIQALNVNGSIMVFGNSLQSYPSTIFYPDIDMIKSVDGGSTWTSETRLISARGINSYLNHGHGFSARYVKVWDKVALSYEGSDDKIRVITSDDWGDNWDAESANRILVDDPSYDPILSSEGGYLTYMSPNSTTFDQNLKNVSLLFIGDFTPLNPRINDGYLFINLSWSPPSGKVFDNYTLKKYEVFRGSSINDLELHATVINGTWLNETLVSGTPLGYYYSVRAVFSVVGPSGLTEPLWGETEVPEFIPTDPNINDGYLYINFSWNPPSEKVFNNFTFEGYEIFRGSSTNDLILFAKVINETWLNETFFLRTSVGYYYSIRAVFTELGSSNLTVPVWGETDVPGPITNFRAIPGDLKVDLSWTPPPVELINLYPLEGYTLYRGRYFDTVIRHMIVKDNYYGDLNIGLEPATYYYRLTYTLEGIGEWLSTEIISAAPNTLSLPPQDLEFADGDRMVSLSWSEPDDIGTLPLTGYNVYRGKSQDDMKLLGQTAALTRDDEGLEEGQRYIYQIGATNRLGESRMSDPVVISFNTISSSPTEIMTATDFQSIQVSWDPPKVTWGLPILEYRIYRGTKPDDLRFLTSISGDLRSMPDSVQNGVNYYYAISAVNMYGESELEGPISAHASGYPGRVTGLTASVGDGMVTISWQGVNNDGGAPIIGYKIYRGPDGASWNYLDTISAGLMRYRDVDLENGIEYYYWISSFNRNDESMLEGPIMATPGSNPYSILEIGGISSLYSGRIWWDGPKDGGDEITGYRIYRGEAVHSLSFISSIPSIPSEDTYEYLDLELEYGTTYYYGVTAVNSWGGSEMSPIVPISPFGAPGIPEITYAHTGLTDLYIIWAPPMETGGSDIIGYRVYQMEEGALEWEIIDVLSPFYEIDISTPGKSVKVRISAYSDLIEGATTEILEMTVGSPPGKVRSFSAKMGDSTSILSWVAGDDNGFSIQGFRVYGYRDGVPVLITQLGPDATGYEVLGLENGLDHFFSVSSVNELGEGPIAGPISLMPLSVPGIITDLWIERVGEGEVLLRWNLPEITGGLEITTTNIYRGEKEGLETLLVSIEDVDHYLDDEVVNGRTYHYFLTVENEIGESEESNKLSTLPLGVPEAIGEFSLDPTTDTITVEWEAPRNDGGTDILGYLVYKGTDPEEMKLWRNLGPNTFSAEDEDVKAGTYYYQIFALNEVGQGEGTQDQVDVPARTGSAFLIAAGTFMAPVLLALLVLLVIFLVRRPRKEKVTEASKRPEEEKTAIPVLPPTIPAPLALAAPTMGTTMFTAPAPRASLPPAGLSSVPPDGQGVPQVSPPSVTEGEGSVTPPMQQAPSPESTPNPQTAPPAPPVGVVQPQSAGVQHAEVPPQQEPPTSP